MNENKNSFEKEKFDQTFSHKEKQIFHCYAEVEFGRPSKECINFGICRIDPIKKVNYLKKEKRPCSKSKAFKAMISYSDSGQLEMTFLSNQFEQCCKEKYFSTGYFKVEEAYSSYLRFDDSEESKFVKIKAGDYLITKTLDSISIIFH